MTKTSPTYSPPFMATWRVVSPFWSIIAVSILACAFLLYGVDYPLRSSCWHLGNHSWSWPHLYQMHFTHSRVHALFVDLCCCSYGLASCLFASYQSRCSPEFPHLGRSFLMPRPHLFWGEGWWFSSYNDQYRLFWGSLAMNPATAKQGDPQRQMMVFPSIVGITLRLIQKGRHSHLIGTSSDSTHDTLSGI